MRVRLSLRRCRQLQHLRAESVKDLLVCVCVHARARVSAGASVVAQARSRSQRASKCSFMSVASTIWIIESLASCLAAGGNCRFTVAVRVSARAPRECHECARATHLGEHVQRRVGAH